MSLVFNNAVIQSQDNYRTHNPLVSSSGNRVFPFPVDMELLGNQTKVHHMSLTRYLESKMAN